MERRTFSLLDAMALVAATAVGMGLVRGHFVALKAAMPQVFTTWPPITAMNRRVPGLAPLLAAWSLAMIGLHLSPPRPSFRHLARSPGFAASLASGFGILLWLATDGVGHRLGPWMRGLPVPPLFHMVGALPHTVAVAIASAWISIAAGGRWRRRRGRDWREPLAVAFAWAWILLYTAQWLTAVLRD